VTLKTFLLAVTAAVALFGAAVVGVPSTTDKVFKVPPIVRAE
jgi:hypothetical protein